MRGQNQTTHEALRAEQEVRSGCERRLLSFKETTEVLLRERDAAQQALEVVMQTFFAPSIALLASSYGLGVPVSIIHGQQ